MRSRIDRRAAALLVLLLIAASCPSRADDAASAPPVTPERVAALVAELRASDAVGTHRERSLRWKPERPASAAARSERPNWLIDLARWLSEAGRGLMWLLGATAIALVIVFAWRWAQVRADVGRARAALRPSHVNDLDIRPESLPEDIAGAARALSGRGEQRAALSLLYRGALSRLVHDHGIAVRAASTEGECIALARRALNGDAGAFFERLVRAWQTEVYAGRAIEAASVAALCDGFDTHLAARPPAATATATTGAAA